jgi:hypothetical protein
MEVKCQLDVPLALPPEKRILFPSDKLDVSQRRSVHWGEEKNRLPLPSIEPQFLMPFSLN